MTTRKQLSGACRERVSLCMMKYLLPLSIGVLFLTGKCKCDNCTAEWVLGQVFVTDKNLACMTKDELDKNCIVYFQCRRSATFMVDGIFCIMDVRSDSCPRHMETSCTNNNIRSITLLIDHVWETSTHKTTTTTTTTTTTRARTSSTTTTPVTTTTDRDISETKCSVYNVDRTTFVNNNEFPWAVTIMLKAENMHLWYIPQYLGSGVLIHPSVVLTSALSYYRNNRELQANKILCRAGEKVSEDLQSYSFQSKNVTKVILHDKEYSGGRFSFIALLILEEPFQLNGVNKVLTACVSNVQIAPDNDCYTISKYFSPGSTHNMSPVGFKKVKIKFVDQEMCRNQFDNQYNFDNDVQALMSCGTGVVDAGIESEGIIGSPIVCPMMDAASNTRYAVVALEIFESIYTQTSEAEMYFNILPLKSWIKDKINKEGLETYTYSI